MGGGCSGGVKLQGTVPKPSAPQTAKNNKKGLEKFFIVGTSKVDITPLPGLPMAGYALLAKVARGYWGKIWARIVFIGDSRGRHIVLVTTDLWSMPAGIGDRVAELLASSPAGRFISREHIIISATHSHQSPGNYSSWKLYNRFASCETGFDPRVFEFFCIQIATGIVEAWKRRRLCQLWRCQGKVGELQVNRSFPPFLENPEATAILKENHSLPVLVNQGFDKFAYLAVDPTLTVLVARPLDASRKIVLRTPLAVCAFYAVHPLGLGPDTQVYSGDFYMVACVLAEQYLLSRGTNGGSSDYEPMVALFNGAEGDMSPYATEWNRRSALALGERLALGIAELADKCESGGKPLGAPGIDYRFRIARMSKRQFRSPEGHLLVTAAEGFPGAGSIAGTVDGQSLTQLGFKPGLVAKNNSSENQGTKREALDVAGCCPTLCGAIRRAVVPEDFPDYFPIGVYRIGSMVLGTLPGEFTMTMGRRISTGLATALKLEDRAVLIGLANEYISYFATPEEYALQYYEGAATMYGPASGPLIYTELYNLARDLETPPEPSEPRKFTYDPGPIRYFDPKYGRRPGGPEEGLKNILMGATSAGFVWKDPIAPWPQTGLAAPGGSSSSIPALRFMKMIPTVRIETAVNGNWEKQVLKISNVPETDDGLNFVVELLESNDGYGEWCAFWMIPPEYTYAQERDRGAIAVRFWVTGSKGDDYHGPVFWIKAVKS